ncbi:MAG: acetate/propionate family kinase [Candidatus Nanopelagicales bacterium]
MRIAVVNAGSSSLKLQILDGSQEVVSRTLERWSADAAPEELVEFIHSAGELDAVGHRVVHGGPAYSGPVLLDDAVVDYLDSLTDLAPLHQPKAVAAIRALRPLLPDIPQVACFDTAFHATIPAANATYAVPWDWTQRWGLRRYGFHGLSHAYASRRGAELAGLDVADARIVTCHLGAGASLCAVRDGTSVDTTMGFTPLEGLVMATRSGSVDPGMVLWLLEQTELTAEEISIGLTREGGLAGVSGVGGDLRDVVDAAAAGSDRAGLALAVYDHSLASLTSAMINSCGGLDALVFTGGVGEHSVERRANLSASLEYLGVELDAAANSVTQSDGVISSADSSAAAVVVTAREDLQIAHSVERLLRASYP